MTVRCSTPRDNTDSARRSRMQSLIPLHRRRRPSWAVVVVVTAAAAVMAYAITAGMGTANGLMLGIPPPTPHTRHVPSHGWPMIGRSRRRLGSCSSSFSSTSTSVPSSLSKPSTSCLMLASVPPHQQGDGAGAEADRLRREAQRLRRQAEEMDYANTIRRVGILEGKLDNPVWVRKHPPGEVEVLQEQLQRLRDRLSRIGKEEVGKEPKDQRPPTTLPSTTITGTAATSDGAATKAAPPVVDGRHHDDVDTTGDVPSSTGTANASTIPMIDDEDTKETTTTSSTTTTTTTMSKKVKNKKSLVPPMAGYDDVDLALYIPVAKDIERMVPNATIEERIELFRTAPELQKHFQDKIQRLLVGPLEDIQTLETLRRQYLDSTSRKERDELKKKMEHIEASLSGGDEIIDGTGTVSVGPIGYSDSIRCNPDDLPPLSEKELEERIQAIRNLPDILIAIYKQRNGLDPALNGAKTDIDNDNNKAAAVDDDDDGVRLAILLDYYEAQIQLLEQVGSIDPFTDEQRQEFISAYESLPPEVRQHFASNIGMDDPNNCTAEQVLTKLRNRDSPLSPLVVQMMEAGNVVSDSQSSSGYGGYDIDFVDRSRFLDEFFPAISRMEGSHPTQEAVDQFVTDCLQKDIFMVTERPQRVVGGYYIRGQNRLSDGEHITASDKLVKQVSQRLANHPTLNDQIEFFYILDPTPPTDEDLEFGTQIEPLILVATINQSMMYLASSPLTKTLISLTGLISAFLFSVGSFALNPAITTHLYNSLDVATETGRLDVQWFLDLLVPMYLALGGIIWVHELAHWIVAFSYKFEIGPPSIIPSVTTGITGSITPIKSPPPNAKALFDFAIAGPLAGLVVSLPLLVSGLQLTQTLSLNTQLPVLPVDFVRSSSLGGGLVQYYLGNVAVLPDLGPNAVVELHPLAIAGFLGCIINALAMLPLGHTDGGRISLAMFGRRGAFVTKLFTTLILVAAGLFGLDKVNILLAYALFTLIWQRELETPVRNEVDELDISRGLTGILSAIVVGLILIPMS